ncbi:MAG: hypothetical protein FWC68_04405 [Oscillospiraceae bacterium]|nr:hypothetical protein [Oscillospiraceae bacterium]
MNTLRRFYNEYKTKIWTVILVIVIPIIIIQILERVTINQNNRTLERAQLEAGWATPAIQVPVQETNPVLNEETISESQAMQNRNLISQFIGYANAGRVEDAYNLLTEESKQMHFPTLQDFADDYYRRIFSEHRMYNMQIWLTSGGRHTYRVEFLPDILSSRRC